MQDLQPSKSAFVQAAAVQLDRKVLLCPVCGRGNLHHSYVTVYERDEEDADTGRTVSIQRDVTVADGEMDGNPSGRRNGLKINFWCEHCIHTVTLKLAQHQGATLLEWDVEGPSWDIANYNKGASA